MTAGNLSPELEDWWTDFARSLRRRGKSDATAGLYRDSFRAFWQWAVDVAVDDRSR
jgi:hypothetical protein